jgi:hypothetical protein
MEFERINRDSLPGVYIPLMGDYWIQVIDEYHWVKLPLNDSTYNDPVQRLRSQSPIDGVIACCVYVTHYTETVPEPPKTFRHPKNGKLYFYSPQRMQETVLQP